MENPPISQTPSICREFQTTTSDDGESMESYLYEEHSCDISNAFILTLRPKSSPERLSILRSLLSSGILTAVSISDSKEDLLWITEPVKATLRTICEETIWPAIPRQLSLNIIHSLAKCLSFLHEHGCIYGYLRPEDIVISEDLNVCLRIPPMQISNPSLLQKRTHMIPYLCPEILYLLEESREVSTAFTNGSDIWSLGCIAAELLVGRSLFSEDLTSVKEEFNQIEHDERALSAILSSPTEYEFVRHCLCISAKDRWSAHEAMNASLFREEYGEGSAFVNIRLVPRQAAQSVIEAIHISLDTHSTSQEITKCLRSESSNISDKIDSFKTSKGYHIANFQVEIHEVRMKYSMKQLRFTGQVRRWHSVFHLCKDKRETEIHRFRISAPEIELLDSLNRYPMYVYVWTTKGKDSPELVGHGIIQLQECCAIGTFEPWRGFRACDIIDSESGIACGQMTTEVSIGHNYS